MTYWLTENSTVPMITGAILVVILLFMAFSGRDRLLAYAALGIGILTITTVCLLYTSPSPRDATLSRMPSSA